MLILFQCEQCGKNHQIEEVYSGKRAKCPCGNTLTVPSQKDIVTTDLEETFNRFSPFRLPLQATIEEALQQTNHPLLQISISALVGALLSLSAADRGKVEPSISEFILPATIGALLGGLAGLLLSISSLIKKKKLAGKRVPLIPDLFLGKSWLSVILWVITAFLGAILFVILDVATV